MQNGRRPTEAPPDVLTTGPAGSAAIRGGFVRIAGYAVGVALSLVSTALLLRHLGVRSTGSYVTVLSLTGLAAGLTEGGLTVLGVRELARGGDERAGLLGPLIGLRLVLTSLGMVGAAAFAVVAGYGGVVVAGTAVAAVARLVENFQLAATIPLQAALRFGWVTLADLARQVVSVACVVALVLAGVGLVPLLAAAIPAAIASAAVTVWALRDRRIVIPSLRVRPWAGTLRAALPWAIATALGAAYLRAAVLVVSLVSTRTQTGYFGASFRVIEVLAVVPQLLVGTAFPIFARAATSDRDRLRYVLERSTEVALMVGLLIAVDLVVGARLVIDVVGGSAFAPAAEVLRIQAGTLVLIFVNAVLAYTMLSLGMYRSLLSVTAVAFAMVLVMSGVLAPGHGAVGGAIATVAGEAAMFALMTWFLLTAHRDLRPSLRRAGRIALSAAAAVAVALLDLPSVLAVAAATAVYAGGLVVLRAIPGELFEELRRIRRPPAAGRAQA